MSGPVAITFNPGRLAQRFSALQPAQDPVQSASSAIPVCCLQTTLRIGSAMPERVFQISVPAGTGAATALQIVALPPSESDAARVTLSAKGPSECPPGRPNEVQILAGGNTSLKKQIPFERWILPMQTTLEFSVMAKNAAALLGTVHPFLLRQVPPAMCVVSIPGCSAVGAQASIAVFPDIRWEGGIGARAVADASQQKGFRIEWESTVRAWCGRDEWRPRVWEDALLWCPWFEVLDPIARTITAIAALRQGARDQGFDNPRLVKMGELQWAWPSMRVAMEARLCEQLHSPLVEPSLEFRGEADPLAAVAGEMSLLGHWLENPLWWKRLAPVLTGLLVTHPAEIAQELGVWLVMAGKLHCRIQHEEGPGTPRSDRAEAGGRIELRLEGRSNRDYETIIVRAGCSEKPEEPSEISLEVLPPEESVTGPGGVCRARLAFTGLSVWSLEKRRPGIRIRHQRTDVRQADVRPPAPLAMLLAPRRWPAEATSAPAPIPWHPT